jgi:hypothetical protein
MTEARSLFGVPRLAVIELDLPAQTERLEVREHQCGEHEDRDWYETIDQPHSFPPHFLRLSIYQNQLSPNSEKSPTEAASAAASAKITKSRTFHCTLEPLL